MVPNLYVPLGGRVRLSTSCEPAAPDQVRYVKIAVVGQILFTRPRPQAVRGFPVRRRARTAMSAGAHPFERGSSERLRVGGTEVAFHVLAFGSPDQVCEPTSRMSFLASVGERMMLRPHGGNSLRRQNSAACHSPGAGVSAPPRGIRVNTPAWSRGPRPAARREWPAGPVVRARG